MTTLAEALAQLDGKPMLSADDALTLRRILYGGATQVVAADEAEALVKLNADAGDTSPEWRMLFVEALTDYVVRQEEPAGYVNDAKADWLMAAMSRDRCAKDDEVEALVYVLEQADRTPPRYAAFVLETLKSQILGRTGAKGVTAADVERLRRVLFAAGGEGNVGVSQHEAEALFDLNDALRGATNDPAWSDFFVRAVANAVLYQATWQAPDAQTELGREAWLADTAFHLPNLKSLLHPLQALATPTVGQAWRAGVDADEATEARASQVTGDEAHWLTARIGKDGQTDPNEQALLRFLADNASSLDPELKTLVAAAA
jgi:hypothetical protein